MSRLQKGLSVTYVGVLHLAALGDLGEGGGERAVDEHGVGRQDIGQDNVGRSAA